VALGGLLRTSAHASVRHVEHDHAFAGDDVYQVVVHCVIETRDAEHITRVRDRLEREGFQARLEGG